MSASGTMIQEQNFIYNSAGPQARWTDSDNDSDLVLDIMEVEKVRVTSNGNVGIGTDVHSIL